jgi:hypothetical protein
MDHRTLTPEDAFVKRHVAMELIAGIDGRTGGGTVRA